MRICTCAPLCGWRVCSKGMPATTPHRPERRPLRHPLRMRRTCAPPPVGGAPGVTAPGAGCAPPAAVGRVATGGAARGTSTHSSNSAAATRASAAERPLAARSLIQAGRVACRPRPAMTAGASRGNTGPAVAAPGRRASGASRLRAQVGCRPHAISAVIDVLILIALDTADRLLQISCRPSYRQELCVQETRPLCMTAVWGGTSHHLRLMRAVPRQHCCSRCCGRHPDHR